MEVSKGAAHGLGLSQFAIVLGIVLFTRPLEVTVFVPRGSYCNETGQLSLQGAPGWDRPLHMGLPVAGASFLAACFSFVTYRAHEQGLWEQDYTQEAVDQMGMWDALFWAFCGSAHLVVGLVLCDPADLFGVLASPACMSFFVARACAPRAGGHSRFATEMNLAGYAGGVMLLAYQVTSPNGTAVLAVMILLDYMLLLGHAHDREAVVETACNARIFYACVGSLGCAALYAMGAQEQTLLHVS